MGKKMRVFRLGWFWINVPIWLEEVHKYSIKSIHLWQNQDRLDFPFVGNQVTLLKPSFITEEQNTWGHSDHLIGLRNHQSVPCHTILLWDPDHQLWKTPPRQPTSHGPRGEKPVSNHVQCHLQFLSAACLTGKRWRAVAHFIPFPLNLCRYKRTS